ncbi:MAG TPA: hypothetical protein VEC39_06335 [Vicinamibacterales bacterium]|nr:hypothetical protein [Vicinamibacterales bacterium]
MCPLCKGHLELVYDRAQTQVFACADCRVGITVPAGSWRVAEMKRQRSHEEG